MIDENLVQQLKTFILKNYEMVAKPKRKIDLSKSYAIPRRRNSFEDIANTLKGFINKQRKTDTFSTMLEQFRLEKGLTASQLYNGAWVKKQLFSKIMGNRHYHPSKNTVISFGLSLNLNKNEMDDLLESAGYKFSRSSIADLVIVFCLEQGIFDLHDVNALLLSADQKVLCRE